MWPFRRRERPSLTDAMAQAAQLAATRWAKFSQSSGIPDNINLRDRVGFFASDFRKEMGHRFPPLRHAPDELVLLTIAEGIELSGLESRRLIERQLGIVLP